MAQASSYLYALRRELAAAIALVVALLCRAPIFLAGIIAACAWALCNELTRTKVTPEPTIAQRLAEFEKIVSQLPSRASSPYARFLESARAVAALPDTTLDPVLKESLLRECLSAAVLLGKKLLEGSPSLTRESVAEQEYRELIGELAEKLDAIHTNARNQQDQAMRAEVAAFRELLAPSPVEENINRHG